MRALSTSSTLQRQAAASLARGIVPVLRPTLRVGAARMSVSAAAGGKVVVSTDEAPAALGPYSQVSTFSDGIFLLIVFMI